MTEPGTGPDAGLPDPIVGALWTIIGAGLLVDSLWTRLMGGEFLAPLGLLLFWGGGSHLVALLEDRFGLRLLLAWSAIALAGAGLITFDALVTNAVVQKRSSALLNVLLVGVMAWTWLRPSGGPEEYEYEDGEGEADDERISGEDRS